MNIEDKESPASWAELDLSNLDKPDSEEIELIETSGEDNSDSQSELRSKNEAEDNNEDEDNEKAVKIDPKKPSRAQERIRQLVREKKAYAARAAELEEALNHSKKSEFYTKKASVDTLKSSFESTIASKTSQASAALSSGDFDTYTQLSNELVELNVKKTALGSWNEQEPEALKSVKQEESNEDNSYDEDLTVEERLSKANIPEAGVDWIKKNPKFIQDETFRNFSLAINNELIAKGEDPETDEFYEALDNRLQELNFKSGARLNRNKTDGPALKGNSSTPVKNKNGRVTVTYTQQDKDTAERLGVPLKEYMKQKVKTDQRSEAGGWAKAFNG